MSDLAPMPCPYCDYVHLPTKSGFGLTAHIMDKHPDKLVAHPIVYDEDLRCPGCDAPFCVDGPFSLLHKSGCQWPVQDEPWWDGAMTRRVEA